MSSYIDHMQNGPWAIVLHSWRDFTRDRLIWLYGEDGLARANGKDPKTQADIARWNALGRKDAA